MSKTCSKCSEFKSLDAFYKASNTKDGLRSNCKSCAKIVEDKYRSRNRESTALRKKTYYENNKDSLLAKKKLWSYKNRDKLKRQRALWLDRNKTHVREYARSYGLQNKQHISDYQKQRRIENPALYAFYTAKRKAAKLKATPKWLTPDQWCVIKDLYTSCPPGHHVDHIEPLQGKNVSGLHVPWNLQIITAEENLRKGNR